MLSLVSSDSWSISVGIRDVVNDVGMGDGLVPSSTSGKPVDGVLDSSVSLSFDGCSINDSIVDDVDKVDGNVADDEDPLPNSESGKIVDEVCASVTSLKFCGDRSDIFDEEESNEGKGDGSWPRSSSGKSLDISDS